MAVDLGSTACYEKIIQIAEPRGESLHRANALLILGLDAWRRDDATRAAELQRSGLEIKLGLDEGLGPALGLEALAWAIGALAQHQRAALGDQAYTVAFRRGRQMPLAQVLYDGETKRRSTRSGQVDAGGVGLLTAREEEVAALLGQGLSNKEIANCLVIAQRTAETHVENVLVKLGLTSRSQVAAGVAEHRRGEPAE
jgi:DNA-binding CsgD family transcriptional regulator